MHEEKPLIHPEEDPPDVYTILMNHERRIARMEGQMKLVLTLLGLNTSLLIAVIGMLLKVVI